jgi:Zn-dependent peptidase ImmA (M78 family)/DNA-binding XRE family transcriptional regulator
MAITQQELSRRIRAARDASGLTQEEVAKRLGIPRSAVAQIELGNRTVSSLELDSLAFLFGRDIRELIAESFQEVDSLAALFRAQPDVAGQSDTMEKLRECVAMGREITNLERLVNIDRSRTAATSYSMPLPATRWEAIQQGLRLADDERRRLGFGSAPLPDLVELLEAQGVRTGLVDLPEDVSGFTLNDRKIGLFVVVNREHPVLRRRFSFAHEYAHVLIDRARFGVVSRSAEREDLPEVRANSFAAGFLMPEAGVRAFIERLGKGRPSRSSAEVFDGTESTNIEGRAAPGSQAIQIYDVVRLAHHFDVSRSAALYRLLNLGLLSQPEFDRLLAIDESGKGLQLADKLGLHEPDDNKIGNDFYNRFLTLAFEAYRREEISRGKLVDLAAMVGMGADDLDRLLADAGLDDATPEGRTP